ncbi:HORMA domain-domain-containing protein [Phakopsora pachyrhizi]|uniref:HORMA domain-domain-containing protein n=1 Tax=Phakopsora pachyrhizi TaxID=170000 RepID=A0AAV0AJA8_PHAPC|nr:HORMA domain-domain-containing protein [Phakopsora pachyrhizi]
MAKTSNRTKVSSDASLMTSTQSLSVVKTLVQTGIGVITYLRGIFPDECFNDDRIGPDRSEDSTQNEKSGNRNSAQSNANREGRGYIRVKNIKRGASKESDMVLDYLEEGVMDAILKGYLRQLFFAIYLDPEKPRDVIECYTFDFTYSKSPEQSNILIPELEVRDQLRQLSLGGKFSIFNEKDSLRGQKTGGMVKRQVQALIKNLICSTQSLSDINGRRFLTFKLHYNSLAPADYEPPYFRAADPERDRFTFETAGIEEVPNTTEMGKVDTGFHSVRVALATISGYLPEHDTFRSAAEEGKTPKEAREIGLMRVREEAKARSFVWDTEAVLAPSPPTSPSGRENGEKGFLEPAFPVKPIGVRGPGGEIFPLSNGENEKIKQTDSNFVQILERGSKQKNFSGEETDSVLDSTQPEQHSQLTPPIERKGEDYPDCFLGSKMLLDSPKTTHDSETSSEACSKLRKSKGKNGKILEPVPQLEEDKQQQFDSVTESQRPHHLFETNTTEISSFSLPVEVESRYDDHETNSLSSLDSEDSIESFTQSHSEKNGMTGIQEIGPLKKEKKQAITSAENRLITFKSKEEMKRFEDSKEIKKFKDSWPQSSENPGHCECQDKRINKEMIQCEICSMWRHLACYGYKSNNDPKLPKNFVCYRCRIHKGLALERIWEKEDDIKAALETLRGLCIFRRALTFIYENGVPTAIKSIDISTASQLKNRLKAENFICVKHSSKSVQSNILESERYQTASLGKGKNYKFGSMALNQSYEQKKLRDYNYFSPGIGAEADVMRKVGIYNENTETEIVSENELMNVVQNSRSNSQSFIGKAKAKRSLSKESAREDIRSYSHPYETRRQSSIKANKVSIGLNEVEVIGVSWDDWEE